MDTQTSREPGNKEADRLGKEGAAEAPPTQYTAIPFSVGKKLIRSSWNSGISQVDCLY
jgi:hypothetical protein